MVQPTAQVVKIRISESVVDEMTGTSLWQQIDDPDYKYSNDPVLNAAAKSLSDKLKHTRSTRKDKSILIEMSEPEANILYGYMDVWNIGARDNIGWEPGVYLSQVRSSGAMMQRLLDAFGPQVTRW